MNNSNTIALVGAWMLLTVSLTTTATAQESRLNELPDGAAPLPVVNGARWLQQALLLPLMKHPAPPARPKPEHPREVNELTGVLERVGGSALKGTLFETAGDPVDAAEQQRIWAAETKKWRAEEAAITQRVSDETGPALSSMPVLDPYQLPRDPQPLDPSQAAIEQLRNSARNLDQAAADLEDAGKYSAADRLRATANRLRREAREFAALVETPAEKPAAHEAPITR